MCAPAINKQTNKQKLYLRGREEEGGRGEEGWREEEGGRKKEKKFPLTELFLWPSH